MEPTEEPPIKTKEYDDVQREIYSIDQKIEDLNEMISSGERRLDELLLMSIHGAESPITLNYPSTAISLLDKKLEDAVKEIPELENQKRDKEELLELLEEALLQEGWKKQTAILGPPFWKNIKRSNQT